MANGYCTLAELHAHMGKPTDVTANDTLFETCIESASREIDYAITGRRDHVVFKAHTLTASKVRALFGRNDVCIKMDLDQERIYFPSKINTITELKNAGEVLTNVTDYNIGYDFIQSRGVFTSDPEDGVEITGTMGSDTVPIQIKQLCLAMAGIYTGMDTRTMTDADGSSIEISTRSMPKWVLDQLKSLKMKQY